MITRRRSKHELVRFTEWLGVRTLRKRDQDVGGKQKRLDAAKWGKPGHPVVRVTLENGNGRVIKSYKV